MIKPLVSLESLFDDCISELRWGLDGYTVVVSSSTANILVIVLDPDSFPPVVKDNAQITHLIAAPTELNALLQNATPESVKSMSLGFGWQPQVMPTMISNEQIYTLQKESVVGGRKRIMPVMETSQEIGQRLVSPTSLPSMSANATMANQIHVSTALQMSASTGMLGRGTMSSLMGTMMRPDLNRMVSPPMKSLQPANSLQNNMFSNPLEDSIIIAVDDHGGSDGGKQIKHVILSETIHQTVAKTG